MEITNKIENQKFIINRIDTYIESTQNKSNVYLALNTIVFGGVITLMSIKVESYNCILNTSLIITSILSFISVIQTLRTINPYLKKSSNGQDSILFFNDIMDNDSTEYYKIVKDKSEKKILEDLTNQTHIISKGLGKKYEKLVIVGWIVGFEFFFLLLWILTYLTTNN